MERSLIMLIGASGSGKTTLGKTIVEQLKIDTSIEHISTGNLVRHIGSGVIKSARYQEVIDHLNSPHSTQRLDDEIMYTIISEALTNVEETDVILLDGAPRTATQVNDISELAVKDSRRVAGVIFTFVENSETGMTRLSKRRPREFSQKLTSAAAIEQHNYSSEALSAVTDEFSYNGVTPRYVETSGQKSATATQGLAIVRRML
jgi:adenylate kinase family enzyme